MTALKKKVPHSIISCFFLMYFVILFAERLQSLIRAAAANQLFMDAFEGVASIVVSLSLLSAVVLLAFLIYCYSSKHMRAWLTKKFYV